MPLPLRRALGPKRHYRKSFRRSLAIAIAVASAGAAISAWRGEEHARVAEEQERAAFDQTIALEQQRAEIRVSKLLDVISTYTRMKSAELLAQELQNQATADSKATYASQLRADSVVYRNLRYDLLDSIPKDALTPNYALTAATLNAGPSGIPDCPRSKAGPAGSGNVGKFGLELQFKTTESDLCPVEEVTASAHDFGQADDQIGVAALFILAAFLFTIAQISSRPRAVALGVGGRRRDLRRVPRALRPDRGDVSELLPEIERERTHYTRELEERDPVFSRVAFWITLTALLAAGTGYAERLAASHQAAADRHARAKAVEAVGGAIAADVADRERVTLNDAVAQARTLGDEYGSVSGGGYGSLGTVGYEQALQSAYAAAADRLDGLATGFFGRRYSVHGRFDAISFTITAPRTGFAATPTSASRSQRCPARSTRWERSARRVPRLRQRETICEERRRSSRRATRPGSTSRRRCTCWPTTAARWRRTHGPGASRWRGRSRIWTGSFSCSRQGVDGARRMRRPPWRPSSSARR